MSKPASPISGFSGRAAFTLVELLTVVALMVIFLAFAIPAVSSVLSGLRLSRGGQQIADQIILGRQTALTRNRNVEVRFIRLTDPPTPGYRGVQIWMVDEAGTVRSPVSRMITLPDSVIINSNSSYSPLVFGSGSTVSGQTNFTPYGSCQYTGFRFRANGQTDIPTGNGTNSVNYITLQNATDSGSPPKNFFTIQINPLTGKVAVLRP